jgi:hypothetical protein
MVAYSDDAQFVRKAAAKKRNYCISVVLEFKQHFDVFYSTFCER